MIVVDTSLICYLFIPGEHSERARKIFLRDTEWCAPVLWQSEFRNVLALYLRKSIIDFETAFVIAQEAERLMKPREYRIATLDVLSLVSRSGCSAYDCEFVALANKLQIRLITSDRQILQAFPDVAVSLKDFASCKE